MAYGCPANMVFRMRLMPEPKGAPRPMIVALDWNRTLDSETSQFQSIIAIGSIARTRIFVRFNDDVVKEKSWEMMFNICHPTRTRSKAVQWNPSDWKILAVGSDDGVALTVQIVHLKGEKFKKCNKIEVPTKHQLVSVCWDAAGQYLLATLDPIDERSSKMIVIKHPTKATCIKSVVDTGYRGPYFAIFPPYCDYIVSCSLEAGTLWVWTVNESNEWNKVSRTKIGGGISKMSFSQDGKQLAGIGSTLRIWDYEADTEADVQPKLKVSLRGTEVEDTKTRRRGVTLEQHCSNLSSVFFCSNGMVLTGSSKGSMCLHGVPFLKSSRKLKSYKVQAFQFCDVQFMYPSGEITCVQQDKRWDSPWIASGGTDGIVTIWQFVEGMQRPQINRNPNLEIYRYEPKYQSLDDSVNLDQDDALEVLSISTEKNDDLELLLTVKQELGKLKGKQDHLEKLLKGANEGMVAGLKVIMNVAEDLQTAKVENDEITTSVDRLTQLLALGL